MDFQHPNITKCDGIPTYNDAYPPWTLWFLCVSWPKALWTNLSLSLERSLSCEQEPCEPISLSLERALSCEQEAKSLVSHLSLSIVRLLWAERLAHKTLARLAAPLQRCIALCHSAKEYLRDLKPLPRWWWWLWWWWWWWWRWWWWWWCNTIWQSITCRLVKSDAY